MSPRQARLGRGAASLATATLDGVLWLLMLDAAGRTEGRQPSAARDVVDGLATGAAPGDRPARRGRSDDAPGCGIAATTDA